jgi:predicted ATP-grasp superfamily ATP-dependent carboligase
VVKPRRDRKRNIEFWSSDCLDRLTLSGDIFFQELIEGQSCSAVYVADGEHALFLGATRQLIGEAWLNARPFCYCGSIGPLQFHSKVETVLLKLGDVIARRFGLRGLFGIDFVLREDLPFPVEVNPRYTASIEILELASDLAALALHRGAFAASSRAVFSVASRAAEQTLLAGVLGKAVLFARDKVMIPNDAPWNAALCQPVLGLRDFADIPHAEETIEQCQPIVTVFARADTVDGCLDELRQRAQSLDRWLFGR